MVRFIRADSRAMAVALIAFGLFSFTLLLSGFPAHALGAQKIMAFAEAWQQVIAANETLAAAREGVVQAKSKQDGARDLYLPEITISANYLYLDDDVTLSPTDLLGSMPAGDQLETIIAGLAKGYGMSVEQVTGGLTSTITERSNITSSMTAKWPIYTGGRITAAQHIAAGKLGEASHRLALKKTEQFEKLGRYYFAVVLTRRVLNTRVEVEKGLKKHRDNALLLEQQGQIARVERMQAEASYDKAIVERKKADRDLQIAGLALAAMLQSQQPIDPADRLFIGATLPPLAVFLEHTLGQYPGLDILQAKKEQAAGLVAMEQGKYLPAMALFGNYSLYEEDDLMTRLVPDWVVGIGITVPLMDRSGRAGNLHAAKSSIKQVEFLQAQARSDLVVLVQKSYRQAEQAVEEYYGLESSEKLAEQTINLRLKAFSQGLSTSLDVVDAEMFLAGIKTQRAVAVYNYIIALTKLYAVSGEPESFFLYQQSEGTEVK